MAARGKEVTLGTVEDHLFIVGREYKGPNAAALNTPANNIPIQSGWDIAKGLEAVRKQLPEVLRPSEKEWKSLTHNIKRNQPTNTKSFVTTKEVYTLRKDIQGLVIGQTDKNLNELWAICPVLYEKAWNNLYNQEAGYEKVYIKKCKDSRTRINNILSTSPVQSRSRGASSDLLKAWQNIYVNRQWNRYAKFDMPPKKRTDKHFNTPYLLLKAKNITDPTKRERSWMKARPIAPQTKHPMRRLFHITGRAWSFVTANMPGEHFTINSSAQVPSFITNSMAQLQSNLKINVHTMDIEGCFPNMPKDSIREGCRNVLHMITKSCGVNSVIVPKKDSVQCSWETKKRYGFTKVPFEIMLEVMEFALDNTFIKDLEGQLWKQVKGIPMGDPHSPGMTLAACGWMEHKWMQKLSTQDKAEFRAARYMDDIMLFHTDKVAPSLLQDANVYKEPLKLETVEDKTFLETSFIIHEDNSYAYWIKNVNKAYEPPSVWRYMHYRSYGSPSKKIGILKATCRKLHKMASDDDVLTNSAIQKLNEFLELDYPPKVIWDICNYMAATTRNSTWFRIRSATISKSSSIHDVGRCEYPNGPKAGLTLWG